MDNLPKFSTRFAQSSINSENSVEHPAANVGDQSVVLEHVPSECIRLFMPQVPKSASAFLISSCNENILLETIGLEPWHLHGIPIGRQLPDGTVEIATGLRTYQTAKSRANKTGSSFELPVLLCDLTDAQILSLYLQNQTDFDLLCVIEQGYLWRYCVETFGWGTNEIINHLSTSGGRRYGRQYIRNAIALTFLPSWLQSDVLLAKVTQPLAK
jgi:hypothetical protein